MEGVLTTIFTASAGPAGAVIVLLIVLFGIHKLFTEHMVPIAKNYVDNQHETMQNILAEHKEDRKVFQESIGQLAKRQDKLEDDMEDVKTDLKQIIGKI